MLDRRDPRRMRRREGLHAAWEGFIVFLVCVNLALIVFDSLFALQPLADLTRRTLPAFGAWYADQVHSRFALIDLGFVAFFVFDVLLGWTIALFERRYRHWYYYPFAHWYDVLGCIPLAGFRWLRVLRVFSLLIRLQRLGLIDMRRWDLYEFANQYYQRFLDELSNRVMVKMFTRLQEEIGTSHDLAQRLLHGVFRPRRERLLDDLSQRLRALLEDGYRNNRAAIEAYVGALIHQALQDNPQMRSLRGLPLGGRVADSLDDALADIAARLIQAGVAGLRGPAFQALAQRLSEQLFDAWLEAGEQPDVALEELLVDILEVLKQQLVDRQWSSFIGPEPPSAPAPFRPR